MKQKFSLFAMIPFSEIKIDKITCFNSSEFNGECEVSNINVAVRTLEPIEDVKVNDISTEYNMSNKCIDIIVAEKYSDGYSDLILTYDVEREV